MAAVPEVNYGSLHLVSMGACVKEIGILYHAFPGAILLFQSAAAGFSSSQP